MKNSNPYIVDEVHIVKGPLTGWILSDAVRQSTCPKCESDPGYHCQTPSGRKAWPPHAQRTDALISEFGVERFAIKSFTIEKCGGIA